MQLPKLLQGESLTRLLQGAFAGFLATVVIGFGWGGWMLGSTAKKMADQSTSSAIVAALAPVCVDKFQRATEAKATLAQLKLIEFVEARRVHREGRLGDVRGNGIAKPQCRGSLRQDAQRVEIATQATHSRSGSTKRRTNIRSRKQLEAASGWRSGHHVDMPRCPLMTQSGLLGSILD